MEKLEKKIYKILEANIEQDGYGKAASSEVIVEEIQSIAIAFHKWSLQESLENLIKGEEVTDEDLFKKFINHHYKS